MSDLRHDPIEDRWVAMADNRRSRPMEFVRQEQVRKQIICPFCKGNESETPAAVAVYRSDGSQAQDDQSDWISRVVANKYPSFSTNEPSSAAGDTNVSHPPEDNKPSFATIQRTNQSPGVQELIIPSPRHTTSIGELTDRELEVSFLAGRDRWLAIADRPSVQHGQLFLNCRSAAGASLGHLHWQLIGSPLVSEDLSRRAERDQESIAQNGTSLIQRLTTWEREQEDRVLRETEHFTIMCPFASRFPFQVRLVAKDESKMFGELSDDQRNEMAWHCRDVVQRLETLLDHPAYNIILHVPAYSRTESVGSRAASWYLEVFPRLTITAGFEWGTGVWVNPVKPETAARSLRAAE